MFVCVYRLIHLGRLVDRSISRFRAESRREEKRREDAFIRVIAMIDSCYLQQTKQRRRRWFGGRRTAAEWQSDQINRLSVETINFSLLRRSTMTRPKKSRRRHWIYFSFLSLIKICAVWDQMDSILNSFSLMKMISKSWQAEQSDRRQTWTEQRTENGEREEEEEEELFC